MAETAAEKRARFIREYGAYHTSDERVTPKVYHTNANCTEGNNIESYNLTGGKGSGRTKCLNC